NPSDRGGHRRIVAGDLALRAPQGGVVMEVQVRAGRPVDHHAARAADGLEREECRIRRRGRGGGGGGGGGGGAGGRGGGRRAGGRGRVGRLRRERGRGRCRARGDLGDDRRSRR